MENFEVTFTAMPLVIESRGVSYETNLDAYPHDIIRQLLPHAIKQKLADAVSGTPTACYMSSKPDGSPKPSRDQLADWVAANQKTVDDAILAGMQKADDAMRAGKWQVREASGGTVSRWTDEQSLALDLARSTLATRFAKALPKGTKATATNFVALGIEKVSQFFKVDGKRPTWDDKAVMGFIAKQAEAKTRDYMAEAREELARRGEADDVDLGLDDLLADL